MVIQKLPLLQSERIYFPFCKQGKAQEAKHARVQGTKILTSLTLILIFASTSFEYRSVHMAASKQFH